MVLGRYTTILSMLGAAALIVFGEAFILFSIAALGAARAFITLCIIFIMLCSYLLYIYKNKKYQLLKIRKLEEWISKKEQHISKLTLRVLKISKLFGIIVSSFIAGPLPTTIIIGILGYSMRDSFTLVVLSNFVFFGFWISLYSGVFLVVKNFIL